jgi:hypothetical protein
MLYMNLNNNLLLEQTPQAYHGPIMASMCLGLATLMFVFVPAVKRMT